MAEIREGKLAVARLHKRKDLGTRRSQTGSLPALSKSFIKRELAASGGLLPPNAVQCSDVAADPARQHLARLPVGWARMNSRWAGAQMRVGRRALSREKRSLIVQAPQGIFVQVGYAATFFTVLTTAFVGCCGESFFAAFAFSLAANSCLTLAARASVSTL